MLNIIEKLREKPKAYRIRVAFTFAAVVSGIIFLVWLSALGVRFGNMNEDVSRQNESSLYKEVKEGLSGTFETGRTRINETKKELETVFHQQF